MVVILKSLVYLVVVMIGVGMFNFALSSCKTERKRAKVGKTEVLNHLEAAEDFRQSKRIYEGNLKYKDQEVISVKFESMSTEERIKQ